jgi:dihydropteroate synthase
MIQPFYCGRYVLDAARPLIMGIVNLTDDSFSGDGCASDVGAAREHALRLVAEGAHILDLGAESSRPGAEPVSINQEIDRLLPVIEAIKDCGAVISVDTVKPEVMRVAINAGVDMINDISALRAPGSRLSSSPQSKVAVSLMHMQGSPRDDAVEHRPTDDVIG